MENVTRLCLMVFLSGLTLHIWRHYFLLQRNSMSFIYQCMSIAWQVTRHSYCWCTSTRTICLAVSQLLPISVVRITCPASSNSSFGSISQGISATLSSPLSNYWYTDSVWMVSGIWICLHISTSTLAKPEDSTEANSCCAKILALQQSSSDDGGL